MQVSKTKRMLDARFHPNLADVIWHQFLESSSSRSVQAKSGCFEMAADLTHQDVTPADVCKHTTMFKFLLLKQREGDWNTVFLRACAFGNLNVAKCAVLNGALNMEYGVEQACLCGHKEVVEWLVSAGLVQIGALTSSIHWAAFFGHDELVKWWISRHVKYTSMALAAACEGNHRVLVEWLLTKPDVNIKGGLLMACRAGHLELAQYLYSQGGIDASSTLYDACHSQNVELITCLISKGAKDWNDGFAAACNRSDSDIMRLMIQNGANGCCNCNRSISAHNV
jgi:hypothetical protein